MAKSTGIFNNVEPTFDSHNRVDLYCMTDRAIAEETLLMLRQTSDAIEKLAQNPMIRAMIPGL